jgi:hypothetical protein
MVQAPEPILTAATGVMPQHLGYAVAVITDTTGDFEFPHVQGATKYQLIGQMRSLKAHGALPALPVDLSATEPTRELGDIAIQKGHQIRGRLILPAGHPMPPDSLVALYRHTSTNVLDVVSASVAKDGTFTFTSIPASTVILRPDVNGCFLSSANPSRPVDDPNQLIGTIDHDITDLRIVMEIPGELDPFAGDPKQPQTKLEHWGSGSALKAPLQSAP